MAQNPDDATNGVGVDGANVMLANGRWIRVGAADTKIKVHAVFKEEWYLAKPEGLFILAKDGWLVMAQTFGNVEEITFLDVDENYLKYEVDGKIYELNSSEGVTTVSTTK